MAYFVDLFSPETYEAFKKSNQEISGFRLRQEAAAKNIKVGDKLICYLTKLSRWFGILEVVSEYFIDNTPIFHQENDPFVVRFNVKVIAWLPIELAIPIREDEVWNTLSFTREHNKKSASWTGKLRSSLGLLEQVDGDFLHNLILSQLSNRKNYDFDKEEYSKFLTHKIKGDGKEVSVVIPENTKSETNDDNIPREVDVRQSIKIQSLIAKIGSEMGFKIWIPRNDKNAVLKELKCENKQFVDFLPLNYDEVTLKTIEQIDVLWLKGRSIVRAFEVEHTTSIYSGILRMADLLALQPNMDIKLHIVAPVSRKEKVFQEIRRPVFSLLERGPLSESCGYISYDSIKEISNEKHLMYLSDNVLDEYVEFEE